jgi:hypothetical protein
MAGSNQFTQSIHIILIKFNSDMKHLNHRCQYVMKSMNYSLFNSHFKGKVFICALANRKFTTIQEKLQLPFPTTMDTISKIASLVTCITNNTNLFGGHHNYI